MTMSTARQVEFIMNAIRDNDTTTEAEKADSFTLLVKLLAEAAAELEVKR